MQPSLYTFSKFEEGYIVCQNDKPLLTPAGLKLAVPSRALAELLVQEAPLRQTPKPNPIKMPISQLVFTTIDIIAHHRDRIIDKILAFGTSELVCHRADKPLDLAREQHKVWTPLLDWAAERYGAELKVGKGVMPIEQPVASMQALRRAIEALGTFWLGGVSQAVDVSTSLIIGMALGARHITAETAFQASELEESYHIKNWGDDPADHARRERLKFDLEVCQKYFEALSQANPN